MTKKPKALLLFSGGLDSILSVKVLQEAGCEVVCLNLESSFVGGKDIDELAQELGIRLITEPFTNKQLDAIKNNKFGFGKAINPCIDCRIHMIKTAKDVMEREGCDFVATGEVLGQRPFSQKANILGQTAREAGLKGQVLRPLSAKLLPETEVEKSGLVAREKLLDIEGRSRKRQEELVAKYGIKNFPSPGGGCMLTTVGFAEKLRNLKAWYPAFGKKEVELIKACRFFSLNGGFAFVTKDADSNRLIEELKEDGDLATKMKALPGPIALIYILDENQTERALKEAQDKIVSYSRKAREVRDSGQEIEFVRV